MKRARKAMAAAVCLMMALLLLPQTAHSAGERTITLRTSSGGRVEVYAAPESTPTQLESSATQLSSGAAGTKMIVKTIPNQGCTLVGLYLLDMYSGLPITPYVISSAFTQLEGELNNCYLFTMPDFNVRLIAVFDTDFSDGSNPPLIERVSLPNAQTGVPYSFQLQTNKSTQGHWSVMAGLLPQGLELEDDGRIHGTPTQDQVSTFTLRVENTGGFDEWQFTIKVSSTHGHAMCGVTCSHSTQHASVEYTMLPVNDATSPYKGGPIGQGNYFLAQDVVLANTMEITGNVGLCLNGHTLSLMDGKTESVIQVNGGALILCDCAGGGVIMGGNAQGEGDDSSGGGVHVKNGVFNMHGGNITGNRATYGGGIYVDGNATVTITGGRISGNTAMAAGAGGGIFLESGYITLLGNPRIVGNAMESGLNNNLYLADTAWVDIGAGGLNNGAQIGVTTQIAPAPSKPVDITGYESMDNSAYFVSDLAYTLINTGSGSNQKIILASGVPRLNIAAIDLGSLDEGYEDTQLIPKFLEITETGRQENATITAIELAGTNASSFELARVDQGNGPVRVNAGTTNNTTWRINPIVGLKRGEYLATVIVTYDYGQTASAQVRFEVNKVVYQYDVWVSGIRVNSDNWSDVLGNGRHDVTYNNNTQTLTLNDAFIRGATNDNYGAGIYAKGDLNIVLIGSSTIDGANAARECSGIFVHGNTNISGSGWLDVGGGASDNSFGIYSYGTLIIGGSARVDAEAGDGSDSNGRSIGIYSELGNIEAESSVVVQAYGNEANYSSGITSRSGKVTITAGAKVTAEGGHGTTEDGVAVSNSFGIDSGDGITIAGGGTVVKAAGGSASENGTSCGIYTYSDNISIGANAVVQATGDKAGHSFGIHSVYGSVGISGTNTQVNADGGDVEYPIQADSESYGIYAGNKFNVDGGTVIARSSQMAQAATLQAMSQAPDVNGYMNPGPKISVDTDSAGVSAVEVASLEASALKDYEYIKIEPGDGSSAPGGPTGSGYTITFNPNGGTVSPLAATTNADGTLSTLPTPTRENYSFLGWYRSPTGGIQVSTSTVFTAPTIIYAMWSYSGSGNEPTNQITVSVTPSTASVNKGSSQQFYATVAGTGVTSNTVTWEVNGHTSAATGITSTGLLTVGADETAATLTVLARAQQDATKYGVATATVIGNSSGGGGGSGEDGGSTNSAPVITSPTSAISINAAPGDTKTLSITATGATSYQWYVNRGDGQGYVPVSGATAPSYTLPNLTEANDGYTYYCVATNQYGSATSPVYTLYVYENTKIPPSGDPSNPGMWVGIFLVALSGIVLYATLAIRKYRRNK